MKFDVFDHLYWKNIYDSFVDSLECLHDPIIQCVFKHSYLVYDGKKIFFRFKISADHVKGEKGARAYHCLEKKYNHLFKKTAGEWFPLFEQFFPVDDIDRMIMLSFENPYNEAEKYREGFMKKFVYQEENDASPE